MCCSILLYRAIVNIVIFSEICGQSPNNPSDQTFAEKYEIRHLVYTVTVSVEFVHYFSIYLIKYVKS